MTVRSWVRAATGGSVARGGRSRHSRRGGTPAGRPPARRPPGAGPGRIRILMRLPESRTLPRRTGTGRGTGGVLAVLQVADYFLVQAEERGQRLGHLKLQKLCYYAQGFYLAFRREPLFRERLRAWAYGPVVRELWDVHRYARGPIAAPEDYDAEALSPGERRFLDIVLERFWQYSGTDLSRFSQGEAPWRDAYERLRHGGGDVIAHGSLTEWFGPLLAELGTDEAGPPPGGNPVRLAPANA